MKVAATGSAGAYQHLRTEEIMGRCVEHKKDEGRVARRFPFSHFPESGPDDQTIRMKIFLISLMVVNETMPWRSLSNLRC